MRIALCFVGLTGSVDFGYGLGKPLDPRIAHHHHKKYIIDENENDWGNIKRAFTYKALNRLIQGSSADQTKQAMLACHEAGYLPILQLHDELCFNVKSPIDAAKIKKAMENCIEFKLPFVVDTNLGDSWGEAKW